MSTRWPPPGVLVKGSESKLEAKETRLQAVLQEPGPAEDASSDPTLLSLHSGPASPGRQPPSLKRRVRTQCHSNPAAGPATWLTCLCSWGAVSRTMGRGAAGSTPRPIAPAAPVPTTCSSQLGLAPAASVGHQVALPPGRTQPRHVWGSTCAFEAGGGLHVLSC